MTINTEDAGVYILSASTYSKAGHEIGTGPVVNVIKPRERHMDRPDAARRIFPGHMTWADDPDPTAPPAGQYER